MKNPRAPERPFFPALRARSLHRLGGDIDTRSGGIRHVRTDRPAAARHYRSQGRASGAGRRHRPHRAPLQPSFRIRTRVERVRRQFKAQRPEFTPAPIRLTGSPARRLSRQSGKHRSRRIVETGQRFMRQHRLDQAPAPFPEAAGCQAPGFSCRLPQGAAAAGIRMSRASTGAGTHSAPSASLCAWSSATSASTTSSRDSPAITLSSL